MFIQHSIYKFREPIRQNCCMRFVWQGFGSRRATGLAFVRRCQKLPPCLTEPVPAGSRMDLLLAKAKTISDSGRVSEITYLWKGKKTLHNNLQVERGVRQCETALQTPRSVKKEAEEVLQVPEQRIPCSLWRRPW